MNSTKTIDKTDPREIRRKLGLNQQQFWSKIGVTQSGGSRYESGRNMPRPVRELLRLVHVEQIDIQRVKREDMDVIEYLKSEESDLFKTLKKSAKGKKNWVSGLSGGRSLISHQNLPESKACSSVDRSTPRLNTRV